jgi:uncharacterized protein (DUF2252 family)
VTTTARAAATLAERAANGKAARGPAPRSGQGEWSPNQRRSDPLELLAEQATTRVAELIPIRHGRMAESPFSYFRGAALPMAADLATAASSGLEVQLCGDAHLANFGGFASPERELVFDVNDFDETNPGPFEWDLKRLSASLEIAGRGRGLDDRFRRELVAGAVRTYRETVRTFAQARGLDVWYAKLDTNEILARWGSTASSQVLSAFRANLNRAKTRDNLRALGKLTVEVTGELRFRADPPLVVPVEDLYTSDDAQTIHHVMAEALESYRRTLPDDRRRLLGRYRFVHLARKVVGVGSVGTRCWIALMIGRDNDDPLFLQVKEADESVLERFTRRSTYRHHGQRVVWGQKLMQATSDIFLGAMRGTNLFDGVRRDFYVRQLWDWKISASIETMIPEALSIYAQMCGWTLARAHSRSGDAVAIGAYLGSGDIFDRSMLTFAAAYADQNEEDHAALVAAIADGKLPAQTGI